MSCTIIYLEDVFRPLTNGWQNYFDTFSAIFRRAFGLEVQSPQWAPSTSTSINIEKLREYAEFSPKEEEYWVRAWFSGNTRAEEYLLEHIPSRAIILTHEAPVWMIRFFEKHDIKYIETKTSYVRFASDVPILLSTNIKPLADSIHDALYTDQDIRFEADMLKALIRRRFGNNSHQFDIYKNSIIYVGQTHNDSSLIIERNGIGVQAGSRNFLSALIPLLDRHDRIIYQAHPVATKAHARMEKDLLEGLAPGRVTIGSERMYNIFSLTEGANFIGLSSSALLEASFFDQRSTLLLGNRLEPLYHEENGTCRHLNIRARDFLSPGFWQKALADVLPTLAPFTDGTLFGANSFRMRHNISYNYAFIFHQRSVFQEEYLKTFQLHSLPARVEKLEKSRLVSRVKQLYHHMKSRFF